MIIIKNIGTNHVYDFIKDKPFDTVAFANYPKCKLNWEDETTGAGCLITAFFKGGYGIKLKAIFYNHLFKYALNKLFVDYDIKFSLGLPLSPVVEDSLYAVCLYHNYDTGREIEALNQLWELIEKLPKKTITEKSQVKLPVLQEV